MTLGLFGNTTSSHVLSQERTFLFVTSSVNKSKNLFEVYLSIHNCLFYYFSLLTSLVVSIISFSTDLGIMSPFSSTSKSSKSSSSCSLFNFLFSISFFAYIIFSCNDRLLSTFFKRVWISLLSKGLSCTSLNWKSGLSSWLRCSAT